MSNEHRVCIVNANTTKEISAMPKYLRLWSALLTFSCFFILLETDALGRSKNKKRPTKVRKERNLKKPFMAGVRAGVLTGQTIGPSFTLQFNKYMGLNLGVIYSEHETGLGETSNYHGEEGEELYEQIDYQLIDSVARLQYHPSGGSLYLHAGAGYGRFIGSYGIESEDEEVGQLTETDFTSHQIKVAFGVGNVWHIDNFFLGIDWADVGLPVSQDTVFEGENQNLGIEEDDESYGILADTESGQKEDLNYRLRVRNIGLVIGTFGFRF